MEEKEINITIINWTEYMSNLYPFLAPNITIITATDRELVLDGVYEIGAGQIHSHQFEIEPLGQWRVTLQQLQFRQALSLRAWLSKEPNGLEEFFRFHPGDGGIRHIFYDRNLDPAPTPVVDPIRRTEFSGQVYESSDILVKLIPNTFFYNIHNLENQDVSYKIAFLPPAIDC